MSKKLPGYDPVNFDFGDDEDIKPINAKKQPVKRQIKEKVDKPYDVQANGKITFSFTTNKPKSDYKIQKNSVLLKGEQIKFKNLDDLVKKAKLTREQAKDIKNKKVSERLLVKSNGDLQRINTRDKPLVLRQFTGVTKIANKRLLGDNIKIKNTKLYEEIPSNKKVGITVKIVMEITISEETITRRIIRGTNTSPDKIKEFIEDQVFEYVGAFGVDIDSVRVTSTILSTHSNQELTLTSDMRLREANPLDLSNMYTNVDLNAGLDCVKRYLKKNLASISNYVIDQLGNSQGVLCTEIKELCKKYNIVMTIYDLFGKIEDEHIPVKRSKNYPYLNFIAFNNHLYPIHGSLKKTKVVDPKIEVIGSALFKLISFLDQNIYPADVKIDGESIISFNVDGVTYVENDEYEKCKNILKMYGLEDKLFSTIKLSHLFNIISSKYVHENLNSFFPNPSRFIKGGFVYNGVKYDGSDICSIDYNKAYSSSLVSLDFLITTDYRVNQIIENPTTIEPHYLYIAQPESSSILIPDTNVYSGEHLIYCMNEGVIFTVLEGLECVKVFNYYKKMVEDIYSHIDSQDAKEICCIGIGKLESEPLLKDNYVYDGIYNNDNIKCKSGFKIELFDNCTLNYNVEKSIGSIYNKKPISVQIKDQARKAIYLKMKELNITSSNLIQIKTDAISYIGKLPTNLNKELGGWKAIDYKPMADSYSNQVYNRTVKTFKLDADNENVLVQCYAGVGKTYDIINNLLPKLNDYVVLTPSHTSLKEYRENGINCQVIQTYEFSQDIPTYSNIIIDEFGMCNRKAHDFIYKCHLMGKNIYCYGDFKQLSAVENNDSGNSKLNSVHYLNYLFKTHKQMDTNRRNDFTIPYYDSLINSTDTTYLSKEVKKWSTSTYHTADYIICWRNKTVEHYNDLMLKHLKIGKYDKGVKLLVTSNDLRDKELFNNFEVEIIESNNDLITITGGHNFTKKQIDKYFRLGYARTVYGVQGKSINSYYYAPEDYHFLDGETSYVIISRLKTKH